MTSKICCLVAIAIGGASLAGAPVVAQAQPQGMGDCPAGTRYMPPGKDGAGNPVAAYCAADPTGRGANDPYTGKGADDPNASRTGGPTQSIAPTR